MQLTEALRRQRAWGNKPCNHPFLEKEYAGSSSTGDEVCSDCGKSILDCFTSFS